MIRGFRGICMAGGIGAGAGIQPDDILYNALPLYHSNGGVGMAGNAIRQGNTVVLRKKFSARK